MKTFRKTLFFIIIFLSSVFFTNAQYVGIGTTTPTEQLHVVGASNADVIIKNESIGTVGSASFQAKGTGGQYDVFQMIKYNAAVGGSVAGVNLANLSLLYTGVNAGPMLLDVITSNSMQMATGNTVRMTIAPSGNVGIGSATPNTLLNVKGGVVKVWNGGASGTLEHATGAGSLYVQDVL